MDDNIQRSLRVQMIEYVYKISCTETANDQNVRKTDSFYSLPKRDQTSPRTHSSSICNCKIFQKIEIEKYYLLFAQQDLKSLLLYRFVHGNRFKPSNRPRASVCFDFQDETEQNKDGTNISEHLYLRKSLSSQNFLESCG